MDILFSYGNPDIHRSECASQANQDFTTSAATRRLQKNQSDLAGDEDSNSISNRRLASGRRRAHYVPWALVEVDSGDGDDGGKVRCAYHYGSLAAESRSVFYPESQTEGAEIAKAWAAEALPASCWLRE